jgi:hypothetical protein
MNEYPKIGSSMGAIVGTEKYVLVICGCAPLFLHLQPMRWTVVYSAMAIAVSKKMLALL